LALLDRRVVLYLKLLNGSAPDTLLPPFDAGWKDVFKVPWINDPTWDKQSFISDEPDEA
jgi:hypothetical protein